MPAQKFRALAGAGVVLLAGAAALASLAQPQRLPDVLDAPSTMREGAERMAVSGIAAAGTSMLAVGARGMLLRSTDGAAHWGQVAVPVSADLTTVRFTDANTAWAVGHDAVILKSTDAGASWQRMLDGRMLLKVLREAAKSDPALAREVDRTMEQSATPDVWPSALLDIAFLDARRGFAVGAFGLLLATTDGGESWTPWMSRAENEGQHHLYAAGGTAKGFYLAGERGLVLRLDEASQKFRKVPTPYEGTFFGLLADGGQLVVHGLRGNVYASANDGDAWRKVETGTQANVVSAAFARERLWLVSQAGELLVGPAKGDAVDLVASLPGSEVYGAVLLEQGRLALARLGGVATFDASRQLN